MSWADILKLVVVMSWSMFSILVFFMGIASVYQSLKSDRQK